MKRIDTATRQRVIELHKEGKEIKEIPQILNNSNIKISYGSVWNIVDASRSQSKVSEPSNQVDQSPILTIPDRLMRDHSSLPVHEPLSTVANDSKSGLSGCPLSRFIPQENLDLEDSKGNLENNSISSAKINQPTTTITNTNTNPYVVATDMATIKTPATGITIFTLSASGKSLNYVLKVRNIHSVIGAHIHKGNAQQNGPVVLILIGNPTMTAPPTGAVNGVLSKGTSTASDLKGPLAGKQLSDLVNLIKSGNAYVNVHTTQNPKGEIRGQITAGS